MKKLISLEYEVYQIEDLSGEDQDLIKAARESCQSAYAPYSKFQVGASLRLNSGQIVTGSKRAIFKIIGDLSDHLKVQDP